MVKGKCNAVIERLANRIRNGDYHLQGLPGEREIAAEVGVSHMTARKAIQHLLRDGVVYRQPSGRVVVTAMEKMQDNSRQPAQIALLVPAFPSNSIITWHAALEKLS